MEKNICPVCREEGKKVKGEVARNFVKPELKDQLSKEEYFLCLTEGCDVAYYHPEEEKVYRNPDDVKIPIWYKAASGEVFACYGNKITEEEVIKAVVENPLYSREKIIEFMNKKEDCGCSKISPDGEYLYSMFTYETGNCSTYLFSLNADGLPSFSNAIDMSEDSNYHISHFSMSPDGNMVICGLKNIYVRDSGSGGLTPLEMKQLSGGEDNFIRNNSFLWFPPQGSPLPLPRSFDGTLLYSPANYGIVCQKITIDEDEKVLCETQDELSISNLDPESPYRGLSEIVESPNGQLIYGACVDANSLACFFRNENNGELNLASYFSDSRIDGASSIAMTKDGEFIYVACASTGIIAWFSRNDETGEVTYMGRYRNSECLYGLHSLRVLCDAAGAGKFLYGLGKESETLVWFKIVE